MLIGLARRAATRATTALVALLHALVGSPAFAQPEHWGSVGDSRGRAWRGATPSPVGSGGPTWAWVLLAVVVLAAIVFAVRRARNSSVSNNAIGSAAGAPKISTLALRAVAGTLTWLGGLTALLGLGGAVVVLIAGAAADQGVLGLLGAAVPAVGGGVTGLVVMAMGQLLTCIAAIEAHARVIAQHASPTLEETARLRAVIMGRLPAPEDGAAAADRPPASVTSTAATTPKPGGDES